MLCDHTTNYCLSMYRPDAKHENVSGLAVAGWFFTIIFTYR